MPQPLERALSPEKIEDESKCTFPTITNHFIEERQLEKSWEISLSTAK